MDSNKHELDISIINRLDRIVSDVRAVRDELLLSKQYPPEIVTSEATVLNSWVTYGKNLKAKIVRYKKGGNTFGSKPEY